MILIVRVIKCPKGKVIKFIYNNVKTQRRKKSGNYFLLPNCIFDEQLTRTQFVVYSYLVKCSDKNNMCFLSRETIAKNCSIKTLRTVDQAVKELENKGLITKTKRKDYSNRYYLSNLYTINNIYRNE